MQEKDKTLKDKKEFWKAVLGYLQTKDKNFYNTFAKRMDIEELSDTQVTLICHDPFTKINARGKYKKNLAEAIKSVAGEDLEIVIEEKHEDSGRKAPPENKINHEEIKEEKKKKADEKQLSGSLFAEPRDATEIMREKQQSSRLSPRYTFENYIRSLNNDMAFAVATNVAMHPGEKYNPVFIYSGVGLGKTHLIQAIGNKIIATRPSLKVIYTTGETFANELINAIQNRSKGRNTTNDFREKFRKADVLLIDDVQFIIGRDATQEEFFHTFNELHQNDKQIVITSDRPPREFNNLAERITSRFASGMVVDIAPPDIDTRSAILRNKRDRDKEDISNEILDFIAEKIATNIRELEGAYTQVLTHIKSHGNIATIEAAAVALGQVILNDKARQISVNEVLRAICTYYSIKATDLKGQSRAKEYVIPRQVAMYLLKFEANAGYQTIGELLGGRDHTTIMHGADKIRTAIKELGKTRQDVNNVKQIIFSKSG